MVNKVILQGRLTKDIELKDAGGFYLAEFTVAWSEKYKETETRCFLRCKAWRSTAEFLSKYFSKGQELIVEGRMVTEEWQKDGQTQSRSICNVEKVNFCGSKSASADNNPPAAKADEFINVPDTDLEQLPFE